VRKFTVIVSLASGHWNGVPPGLNKFPAGVGGIQHLVQARKAPGIKEIGDGILRPAQFPVLNLEQAGITNQPGKWFDAVVVAVNYFRLFSIPLRPRRHRGQGGRPHGNHAGRCCGQGSHPVTVGNGVAASAHGKGLPYAYAGSGAVPLPDPDHVALGVGMVKNHDPVFAVRELAFAEHSATLGFVLRGVVHAVPPTY
jgi:hypothetical protein